MNQTLIMLLTATLVCLPTISSSANAGCGQQKRQCGQSSAAANCSLAKLPLENLSAAEKASLVLMREEEKLARDVYLTLGRKYDLNVFVNIPRAEQRHMDRIGELLARYDVPDPIADDSMGEFTNPQLRALYKEMVEKGSESATAALQVGATIEDLDLHDLESALADDIDNQDIQQVFGNLAKGSRNHLRAFAGQLTAHGASYEPQHISDEAYALIVNSDWERGPTGGSRGQGSGPGHRHGNGKGRGNSPGGGCRNN